MPIFADRKAERLNEGILRPKVESQVRMTVRGRFMYSESADSDRDNMTFLVTERDVVDDPGGEGLAYLLTWERREGNRGMRNSVGVGSVMRLYDVDVDLHVHDDASFRGACSHLEGGGRRNSSGTFEAVVLETTSKRIFRTVRREVVEMTFHGDPLGVGKWERVEGSTRFGLYLRCV
jgi:hypothetical protein